MTVCASENKWGKLGDCHGQIFCDSWSYYSNPDEIPKKITFWWKDPVVEFSSTVQRLIQGDMIDCQMIKFINICHAGDHGKGKFRFVAKFVIKDVSNNYYKTVYPVGEVG